jgi:hypothetical protein
MTEKHKEVRLGRGGPGLTTKTARGLYRTTVYFDEEERRALKLSAVDENKPISTLLRIWVREKLGLPRIQEL